jgi:hypothetical protein
VDSDGLFRVAVGKNLHWVSAFAWVESWASTGAVYWYPMKFLFISVMPHVLRRHKGFSRPLFISKAATPYEFSAKQTLSIECSTTGRRLATWLESLRAMVTASGIIPLM